jgi:UDP-N-acetylmuramoyl-L-alanyl-D-glutamate--2,6-diaminopimelate ligase
MPPLRVGQPPAQFSGFASDSRAVHEGTLFAAVPGTRVDGHDFVAAAAEAGATAALVERELDVPIPQYVVPDGRLGVAHLAMLFAGDPAADMRVTAVTGTNGKSTTTWLVRWLLADSAPSAAVGTLGVVDAEGRVGKGSLTTPDPIDLAWMLSGLRDEGVVNVALEASSHALDQRRIDGLRFAAIAYTSFSREHLEYHADLTAYRDAKVRLTELLSTGGVCAVNADEPEWRDLRPADARVLRYGFAEGSDVRAVDARFFAGGTDFTLVTPDGEADVSLPLPADFNVSNALAAAAVAWGLGRDVAEVAERLSSAPSVPGRMEVLRRSPTLVFRDYAHTPDSYERVLGTLRGLVPGRVVAVFGCGGDRDPGKRPIMGEIATRLADLSLVTTDNPRSEDPGEICAQVVEGIDPGRYEIVLDRRDAIARALSETGPDDAVVLLGKGHETYQLIGDERLPFDEAAIVEELLVGAGA